ncbi:MAG: sulfate/molybdate ABC transporter ATP-binding protein [Acidimicrobiales bacterium]
MTLDAHLDVTLGAFHLDVALTAEPASVTAVLGPNGAGKTTVLRTLAGTVALDRGTIQLGGRVLDDPAARVFAPPERRRVALVHQDLLLFPHLSALDNVAFGLRCTGTSRAEARRLASAWLGRAGLADQCDARPRTLSGGQAQRVALARSLVTNPDLLLLDEPLAALDAGTRTTTRRDLRRFLDDTACPTILVTHDPLDALTLADRVLVLENGRVTQEGAIAEVTARPRTRYVADLLGTNLLVGAGRGRRVEVGTGTVEVAEAIVGPAFVTISPSAVTLGATRPEGSARNVWPVTVTDLDLLGERVRVTVTGAVDLVAEITPAALAQLALTEGAPAWASVKATEVCPYLR